MGVPYPYATFIAQVLADHPIARQADLLAEDVRSRLRSAWGAFDPTLSANIDQKQFKGTEYYTYTDVALKIPTPIGSDFKIGFERTSGNFFNPDRFVPDAGLLTAGFTIPLGQGIITDERRTALTQARAVRDAGEAERLSMYNSLLVKAAETYGKWYSAWRTRAIAAEGVALARFRLAAVQARVANGDSPPIDTLEASLEVQSRAVTLQESEADYFAARIMLVAYLWDVDGQPVELADGVRPSLDGLDVASLPVVDSAAVRIWLQQATAANPKLRKIDADVQFANALRRLTGQQLIPFAEAGAYAISTTGDPLPVFDRVESNDNYKLALEFKSPLLYLKERGKFGSAGAKLDIKRVERDRLTREVDNAVRIAANDLSILRTLVELQTANVVGFRTLRDAEQVRFLNGESTLLIVNIRERKVLDESVKLAKYEAEVAAARATLAAAIGDPRLLPAVLGQP